MSLIKRMQAFLRSLLLDTWRKEENQEYHARVEDVSEVPGKGNSFKRLFAVRGSAEATPHDIVADVRIPQCNDTFVTKDGTVYRAGQVKVFRTDKKTWFVEVEYGLGEGELLGQ